MQILAKPARAVAWLLNDGALIICTLALLYYASPFFAAFSLFIWATENSRRAKYSFFAAVMTFPVSAYLCSDEKWPWIWSALMLSMHFIICAILFFIYSRKNTDGHKSRLIVLDAATGFLSVLKKNSRGLWVIVAVLLSAIGSIAFLAYEKKYTYYEECVLDKIKDANTAAAANIVRSACSGLYPRRNR